jgi:hypothetical protein
MSLKAVLFSLGCVIAWFVLLPALVIGGGLALFAYAIFAELGASLSDNSPGTVDTTGAREIARRMCGRRYGLEATGATRRYLP